MIDDAASFIKNCSEKTAIIYDVDGDSIGAAAVIAKTIERLFDYIPSAFIINHELLEFNKEIYNEIKDGRVSNVIIVDIAIDEESKKITEIAKKAKVMIIDHHQIRKDLNKFNILHVNPFLWNSKIEPFKYCTSKIAYDICVKVAKIEDLAWLAGLGIINDYCGERWKDFLDKIYEKYPILKEGKEPYSFESNFGLIDHMVTSGYYHSGLKGCKLAYEACLEALSPLDLLEAETSKAKILKKFYSEVQKEINKIVNNWKNYSEFYEDKGLVFLELKTRFSIKSPVSTMISIRNPNCTFVIFKKTGKFTNISLRRQDGKVDCGKLAMSATKNLKNANGGGHAPAAGAFIMTKDLEKFKENVLKYNEK